MTKKYEFSTVEIRYLCESIDILAKRPAQADEHTLVNAVVLFNKMLKARTQGVYGVELTIDEKNLPPYEE